MVEERYHYQEAVDHKGRGCSENFETLFVEKKFCDSHIYSFTPVTRFIMCRAKRLRLCEISCRMLHRGADAFMIWDTQSHFLRDT